jgi:2-hydroxychromene-2-carboxylate isomerase
VPSTAAFYFDLASPLAYLAAERVLHVLPDPAEWRPVLARELPGRAPADAQYDGARGTKDVIHDGAGHNDDHGHEPDLCARVERRARELGLQPIRWPQPFPFDSALAMRVATYAASIGRAVPFAQAAFRQAFAGGHSLEDPDFVLIAAAACEMHPAAVLRGAGMRATAKRLAQSTATAAEAGVTDVPAIVGGGRAFVGEDAPERAAAHMRHEPADTADAAETAETAETADGLLDVRVSGRTGTTPP